MRKSNCWPLLDAAEPMPAGSTTIALVGDLMLGRGISEAARARPPEGFWGDVLPCLRSADAVIGNLESPITTSAAEWRECWKAFRFAAHPRITELLRAANIRAVSLANNHMLDRRARGVSDTLMHLDAAGIAHAGAGRHIEEATRPAILDLPAVKVGFIALTNTLPEFIAGPSRPGTNYVRIAKKGASLALIDCLVRDLRRNGVDMVVLSAHWGPNLRPRPPGHYRDFARAALDLGVDVFHGHSAHLFQGVEIRGNKVILYDTGDFLDDYWTFPGIRTDRSFLFLIDLAGRQPVRLRMLPVIVSNSSVRRACGREAEAVQRAMIRKCRPFGTLPRVHPGWLELDLPAQPARHRASFPIRHLLGVRWPGSWPREPYQGLEVQP